MGGAHGMTASLDASHESISKKDITNSLTVTNKVMQEFQEDISIDWGESIYVYYLKFDYTLADHSVRSCYGDGTFRSSKPLARLPWVAAKLWFRSRYPIDLLPLVPYGIWLSLLFIYN